MASANNSYESPFQASFQRVAETAATYGFALVDEVHSLVDEPAYVPKHIRPRVKQLAVTGLIFFGTLISTLGKLAYEVEAVGRDGTTRTFGKPWFLVLLMFAGEGCLRSNRKRAAHVHRQQQPAYCCQLMLHRASCKLRMHHVHALNQSWVVLAALMRLHVSAVQLSAARPIAQSAAPATTADVLLVFCLCCDAG
eukprot:GHRQ01030293.1.p1 GENE.GHRQ01030293.1~~GHRQ01030293.1.p1  ORF type:complete len:195 (+),score=33.11 GHRQ01030293.1:397-981(+)